jgi:hypothetical protein
MKYKFRVHYWTGPTDTGCMVFRSFETRKAAQEFIDNNAMVYPLPHCRLEDMTVINFGSKLYTFSIVNPDGTVWDAVTVKADRVGDAARAVGTYPGKRIVWA